MRKTRKRVPVIISSKHDICGDWERSNDLYQTKQISAKEHKNIRKRLPTVVKRITNQHSKLKEKPSHLNQIQWMGTTGGPGTCKASEVPTTHPLLLSHPGNRRLIEKRGRELKKKGKRAQLKAFFCQCYLYCHSIFIVFGQLLHKRMLFLSHVYFVKIEDTCFQRVEWRDITDMADISRYLVIYFVARKLQTPFRESVFVCTKTILLRYPVHIRIFIIFHF